jgi:hypothetical protein
VRNLIGLIRLYLDQNSIGGMFVRTAVGIAAVLVALGCGWQLCGAARQHRCEIFRLRITSHGMLVLFGLSRGRPRCRLCFIVFSFPGSCLHPHCLLFFLHLLCMGITGLLDPLCLQTKLAILWLHKNALIGICYD